MAGRDQRRTIAIREKPGDAAEEELRNSVEVHYALHEIHGDRIHAHDA